mmetsp:Transcript_68301/g.192589  ORF Transcript_68301/g.192589 Transcript_68301/m.192589 type:complete len:234 (-) Transcript_68301:177-878(-)
MGQAQKRFYHTQEIAQTPRDDEWEFLGQRTVEVEETENWQTNGVCVASSTTRPWGAACCAAEDGTAAVEEVLVVHHEALRKVNFLLRVDELSGCDLPTVPECVIAAKRAELLKERNAGLAFGVLQNEDTDSSCMREVTEQDGPHFRFGDLGAVGKPDPAAGMHEAEDLGPSCTVPGLHGIGVTCRGGPLANRSSGMTPQPRMHDDTLAPGDDDDSTEDEELHGNLGDASTRWQ